VEIIGIERVTIEFLESGVLSAAKRSVGVSEKKSDQTHMGGSGYIHPRSKKYLDNFDRTFGCKCGPNCCGKTEGENEGEE
jgi:hypothetical protein